MLYSDIFLFSFIGMCITKSLIVSRLIITHGISIFNEKFYYATKNWV